MNDPVFDGASVDDVFHLIGDINDLELFLGFVVKSMVEVHNDR